MGIIDNSISVGGCKIIKDTAIKVNGGVTMVAKNKVNGIFGGLDASQYPLFNSNDGVNFIRRGGSLHYPRLIFNVGNSFYVISNNNASSGYSEGSCSLYKINADFTDETKLFDGFAKPVISTPYYYTNSTHFEYEGILFFLLSHSQWGDSPTKYSLYTFDTKTESVKPVRRLDNIGYNRHCTLFKDGFAYNYGKDDLLTINLTTLESKKTELPTALKNIETQFMVNNNKFYALLGGTLYISSLADFSKIEKTIKIEGYANTSCFLYSNSDFSDNLIYKDLFVIQLRSGNSQATSNHILMPINTDGVRLQFVGGDGFEELTNTQYARRLSNVIDNDYYFLYGEYSDKLVIRRLEEV